MKNTTNNASKNVRNTIPKNVASNASINSDDKKVTYEIDCYILHIVWLMIILLSIIAIICYHYTN